MLKYVYIQPYLPFLEKVSSFFVDNITLAIGYSSYAKRCVSLQKIGR